MKPLTSLRERLLDPQTRAGARDVLRTLSYFRENRRWIAALLVLNAAITGLGFLQYWPLAVLIDSITNATTAASGMHRLFLAPLPNDPVMRIVGLAGIALLLALLHEGLSVLRNLLTPRINYDGLLRARRDLYRKLQALHLDYHRSQPMGDSLYRLTTDTFGFQNVLSVVVSVVFAVASLIVIIAFLAARNGPLTLIALSVAPALIWSNIRFGRRLSERTLAAKRYDSAFTTTVERSMPAMVLTQAFAREDEELHHFGRTLRQCVRAWLAIHRYEVGYGLTVGTILALGGSLILTYGGILLQRGQLTAGELMIFMTYLGLMYSPLSQITGLGVNLQSGLAGARRVFEVLDRDVDVGDARQAIALAPQPRRLTLNAIGFEYEPDRPVLHGINVVIEPGQSVAFVGSSGVGKSTLLSLLPRFYDPTRGAVQLDGHDLRDIKLRDVRRHVALVLQDSIILPTTIAENIAYGRPDATMAEIRQVAHQAGLHHFVDALPHGYDTELRDWGANLSGGQRQRISLARALLTEAPILVLDEPTCALDAQHEQIVHDTLRSLSGNRTVVLVSHRIRTIMECDHICVLDHGTITEQGTHEQLMARRGEYAAMAQQHLALEPAVAKAA